MSVVQKVRLSLYVEYPVAQELGIGIESPTGVEFDYFESFAGSGADMGSGIAEVDRMTLDDDAATPLEGSASPRVGSFSPGTPLSWFIDQEGDGTWEIRLVRLSEGQTGTWHAASLFVTTDGVEERFEATGLPLTIEAGEVFSYVSAPIVVEAGGTGADDAVTHAALEVRITPLLKGIPGTSEDAEGNGVTTIDIEDTILVAQYEEDGFEVIMEVDEGRSATVPVSMYEWCVEGIEAFHHALWIGYWRPGEIIAETVFFGQMNVRDDFTNGRVILEGQDPTAKTQHHYIRRGDIALNVDKNRGRLEPHAERYDTVIQAARNIDEQQDREVPVLGLHVNERGVFDNPALAELKPVEFERGQEAWDLLSQWTRAAIGPVVDMRPNFLWPIETAYTFMDLYDPEGDPEAPGDGELGRYLVPADPEAPGAGEVVFDYGLGADNLEECGVDPESPKTHVHVLDRDAAYRETVADEDSSADVGVWVAWVQSDVSIVRPTNDEPADTTVLREIARAYVKAYGKPPKHVTIKLRPDDVLTRHYGHPRWASIVSGFRIGGDWYLDDVVLARARRGYRYFATLVRIVKIRIWRQNGLVRFDVDVIPAIGGQPGPNVAEEEPGDSPANAAPALTITAPEAGATVSGDSVLLSATASDDDVVASVEFGIDGATIPGGFITAEPYEVTWDSTSVADGSHAVRATATDGGGLSTARSLSIMADNDIAPSPPSPSNLIYVDGRHLRLAADDSIVSMRGANMHANGFVFDQDVFDRLAAAGFTDLRLCIQWDDIEPEEGAFDETNLGYVHTAIERAASAGLRLRILALTNSPQWPNRFGVIPAWAYTPTGPSSPVAPWNTASMFDCLASNGEGFLRKLVQEFGPYDNVSGFEPCNEPDRYPATYVQQGLQRMIEWMRDEPNSAGKIFWVTNCYSSQSAADAYNNWSAIDWTHGDLAATVHIYYAPVSPTDPGWASNGIRRESSPIYWNGYPTEASSYSSANKAALRLHLQSWKLLGQARNVPVELGEAGVQYNKATEAQRVAWFNDVVEAAELEEFVGVHGWITGVTTSGNPWTFSLGSPLVVRPEYLKIVDFTTAF